MIGFVSKRVAGLAVALLVAALLIFSVLELGRADAGGSFWPRFAGWIGAVLLGDFGTTANGPIGPLIADRLAVTLPLAAAALLLAAAVGLPLGMLAAWKPNSPVDRMLAGGTRLVLGLPPFWLGMVLALLFSAALRWLPAGGFVPWAQNPGGAVASLVLPAITLAVPGAAILARATRGAFTDMQAAEFMRTARINKGLSVRQAIWRHGLRSALLPVLVRLGPLAASHVAGTIVVENVFYLPGLGRLVLSAVAEREPTLIQGGLVVLMVLIALVLLAADLLRAVIDPRLRRRSALSQGTVDTATSRGVGGVTLPPIGLRLGVIAALVLLLIGFVSISWTPYPVDRVNLAQQLQDPSISHWLGTDHLGRDLLSLVMKGMLTSFVVAAVAVVIGLLFGVPLGVAAAAFGRQQEWAAPHAGTLLLLFPALVIAILGAAVAGPGAVNAMAAIGIVNIGVFARVTGGGLAELSGRYYVAASRLAGMSGWEVARRHLVPAIANVLMLQVVVQLTFGVLAEAALSYVGLGAQPPGASLGLMLKEAQSFLLFEPVLILVPGIAIALIGLALDLIADGLRGQLDPNLRRWEADNVAG